MKRKQRYCSHCQQFVLADYVENFGTTGSDVALHVVLSLLTCGLWLFVWLLFLLIGGLAGGSWRCISCGGITRRSRPRPRSASAKPAELKLFRNGPKLSDIFTESQIKKIKVYSLPVGIGLALIATVVIIGQANQRKVDVLMSEPSQLEKEEGKRLVKKAREKAKSEKENHTAPK